MSELAQCQSCGHRFKRLADELYCRTQDGRGLGRCWQGNAPPAETEVEKARKRRGALRAQAVAQERLFDAA
jgi:hypothetical protein